MNPASGVSCLILVVLGLRGGGFAQPSTKVCQNALVGIDAI